MADPAALAAYDLGDATVHVRTGVPGSALVPALDRALAVGGPRRSTRGRAARRPSLPARRRALPRHGVDRRSIYSCGYWKLAGALGREA